MFVLFNEYKKWSHANIVAGKGEADFNVCFFF